ncbi:MAG: Uma2 family endonuclease [Alkalinema sp. CAN_BIN05]|nr:Uma2 family endonuclease [Alkalinema sp. CAN_BIN05]
MTQFNANIRFTDRPAILKERFAKSSFSMVNAMTIALEIPKADNLQRLNLADYLAYNDGTDTRYELLEGVLKPMSLGSVKHSKIIRFLDRQFDQEIQRSHPEWIILATLMAVQSPHGRRWDTSRIPDLFVMPVF